MALIYQVPTQLAGQVGIFPNQKFMVSGDSLATITAVGYINNVELDPTPLGNTDIVWCFYNYNINTGIPGGLALLQPSISTNGLGTITLTQWTGDSAAMLVNVANNLTSTGSIVAFKVNGTEAANAVTANGMAGLLTTSALTTAGGASYAITWTDSFITASSVVLLTIAGGTNTTENITLKCVPGAGTATLTIYNNTAATALNGTILISYLVM